MKKILTLAVASLFNFGAYAQSANNPKHMINFAVDDLFLGTLNFDSSKARGQKSDNDTQLGLDLNYAYQLPMLRNLQVGAKVNYQKGAEAGRGDYEDYGADVGAYWNFQFKGNELDLKNSYYASLFVGYGWNNNYGSENGDDDEFFQSTAAIGKRFSLENWGIDYLTYTPEVALQSINSKTGGALEYSQSLQLRFLQFSVLF